jgi:O-antigen/teichoic acid export membrane protein
MNASIGLILLRYLIPGDFSNIGYYGRATALCGLIMLIPLSVGPLLYAKWAGLSPEEKKSQVGLAMRLYLAMGLAAVFGLVISARWLVLLLYGKEFLPVVLPLRILAVGIALKCTFSVCSNLLASDGRAQVSAYVMSISVITTAVSTWILVPFYGIIGAALAFTIAGALVFGIGVFLLKHSYGLETKEMLLFQRSDFEYLLSALGNKHAVSVDKEIRNQQVISE